MLRSAASEGAWTWLERLDFQARVAAHSVARLARWQLEPEAFPAPVVGRGGPLPHRLAEARVHRRASSFGPKLESGRWQNLRLVAGALDGVELTAARPFSFWRTVGQLTAARGFVEGAHFEGGCIVPALGGGICSLSDRLFELALRSDCRILERHAHTLWVERPDGSAHAVDATVKWPYVDLRFAPRRGVMRIGASVHAGHITLDVSSTQPLECEVKLRADRTLTGARGSGRRVRSVLTRIRRGPSSNEIERLSCDDKRVIENPRRTCETCNETICSRPKRAGARG